jgi:hypothetical protein
MHPEAGQFDEVTGVEPVARSRHGNELADNEIAKQFGAGVVIEVHED